MSGSAAGALDVTTNGVRQIVDLHTYAANVHALRHALDQLAGSGQANSQAVRAAAQHMLALREVRLPGGGVLHTGLPLLAGRLDPGDHSSLVAVAQRLDSLDTSLRALRPRPVPPSQLSQLDVILRDPRFHPSRSVLQRIEGWIGARIDDFLAWLANLLSNISIGGQSVSLPVKALLALIFLALVAGVAVLVARSIISRSVSGAAPVDEAGEPITSVAATSRTQESATAGDFRSALRYLLLSTLLELQERGLLTLRPGLTNREYLHSLRASISGRADLPEALSELVDAFDRIWYGHQPIDVAQYERYRARAEEVLRSAGQERVA